ncbi:MAG TPA: hypothetical protein VID30_16160, partial [Bradyrhizobium sp.]
MKDRGRPLFKKKDQIRSRIACLARGDGGRARRRKTDRARAVEGDLCHRRQRRRPAIAGALISDVKTEVEGE